MVFWGDRDDRVSGRPESTLARQLSPSASFLSEPQPRTIKVGSNRPSFSVVNVFHPNGSFANWVLEGIQRYRQAQCLNRIYNLTWY
jgi:hypothetical protein